LFASSVQTKLSASPSGSDDAVPFNVAVVPADPAHSNVWSGPAIATGGWFTFCGALKRRKRIWLTPDASSDHTTFRLPFLSAAICTSDDAPESFDTGCGAENVAPVSSERVKKMLALGTIVSCQPKLKPPPASTVSHGLVASPASLERFCGIEKLVPPSVDRAEKIWRVTTEVGLCCQTSSILPLASTPICGTSQSPGLLDTGLFDTLIEEVAKAALLSERRNMIAKWPELSSTQTMLMFPLESNAI